MSNEDKIEAALDMLIGYGHLDGEHHKMWAIDQAVHLLMGHEEYEQWRADNPDLYWDEGTAP